jgi:hypothetical protein
MSNEDIYPGELPMGLSTLLSRGHCSLLAAHCLPGVEPPRTCSSSSPTWALSNMTDQRAVMRVAIPVNRRGAQHIPVVRPPIHFRLHFAARFEFSQRARAWPEAAVVDDEGVGLPGELFRPTRCRPPRSSPRGTGRYFSAHVQINEPGPPSRHHVVHAGSRNEVIAGRGAAC